MQYTIKAIPTTYAGVNFRSRLEARWAAFFDLCGWEWDYEPFDLEGWAPDFMLKGKTKALVEVKPIDFSNKEKSAFRQAKARAEKAFKTATTVSPPEKSLEDMTDDEMKAYLDKPRLSPEYEILVVGNGPFVSDDWARWTLGVMALEKWGGGEDIADLFWGETQYLDYAARYGNYAYRIGGQWDGDGHLRTVEDVTPLELWREAGNIVQWIPAQRSSLEIVRNAVRKAA